MKKILILSTGGTIGMTVKDGIQHTSDEGTNALADFLRGNKDVAVEFNAILNKDSALMTISDWQRIIHEVADNYDDFDGFIILHGTDTMNEIGAVLTLALPNFGKPIVLTGSIIPAAEQGSDAGRNLADSLSLATRQGTAGVYLAFGGRVIKGGQIQKVSTTEADAFRAVGGARQDKTQPKYARTKGELVVLGKFSSDVIAVCDSPSLDSKYLIALAKAGIRGLVLVTFGDGNPKVAGEASREQSLRPAFEYFRQHNIPIIITSRISGVNAGMGTYGPSQEAKALGAVAGGHHRPEFLVVQLSHTIGQGG